MEKDFARSVEFRRNRKLEKLLAVLASGIAGCEERAATTEELQFPAVFVIGAPRSGTTVLMQWLACSGHFSYPSNLMSRFFAAPYLGALVQELLANPDLDYRRELSDMTPDPIAFNSTIGKTEGALSPNEFWYWWRRFIPNDEPRVLSENEERRIDVSGFRRSLASVFAVWPKPFVAKGIIMQYNLRKLLEIFPRSLFLHTRRKLFFNAQSLLLAREKYYGDRGKWFSVRPPGWEALSKLTPEEQVVGQVSLTVESIEQQFGTIPQSNCLSIDHAQFCRDPSTVFEHVRMKLRNLGCDLPGTPMRCHGIVHNEAVLVADDVATRLRSAVERKPSFGCAAHGQL